MTTRINVGGTEFVDVASTDDPPKPRPELLPSHGLLEAGQVMAAGEPEHGDRWRAHPAAHHVGAALRHTLRWLGGQRNDPDDGLSHLAHAASRLLMATENDREDHR